MVEGRVTESDYKKLRNDLGDRLKESFSTFGRICSSACCLSSYHRFALFPFVRQLHGRQRSS